MPLRLKTNMMYSKLGECQKLLTDTNRSIGSYYEETLKVARNFLTLKNKSTEYKKEQEKIKSAFLAVLSEVAFQNNP